MHPLIYCCAIGATAALHSVALALENDPEKIIVTGARIAGGDAYFDASVTLIPDSYTGITRAQIEIDMFFQWREIVQLAKLDPLNTTDIRCSAIATQFSREVTSLSDTSSRYLAAQQLFTAINGVKGLTGLRAAIAGSTPALYNGRYYATFSVTYIDGGTKKWIVQPGIAPALIVEANVPPAPKGNGEPKPCPATANG